MLTRLKLPQIEQKPKTVRIADSWRDPIGALAKPHLADAIAAIRDCIEAGKPLPPGSYRSGIRDTPDALLDQHSIMHLHLGNAGTRELLFLVQYDDYVVFLETNDHTHFSNDPPGTVLKVLHETKLSALEAKMEAVWQAEKKATSQRIRASLLKKSTKPLKPRLPGEPT